MTKLSLFALLALATVAATLAQEQESKGTPIVASVEKKTDLQTDASAFYGYAPYGVGYGYGHGYGLYGHGYGGPGYGGSYGGYPSYGSYGGYSGFGYSGLGFGGAGWGW